MADYRSGVLNVQKMRPVFSQQPGNIQAQTLIWILGNPAGGDAAGKLLRSTRLGHVSDEFAIPVDPRKLLQQITDINLVARKVTTDGVCVDRESHSPT
jgi:hypothetical protein